MRADLWSSSLPNFSASHLGCVVPILCRTWVFRVSTSDRLLFSLLSFDAEGIHSPAPALCLFLLGGPVSSG